MKIIKGVIDSIFLSNLIKSSIWYLFEKTKGRKQTIFTAHNMCLIENDEVISYRWEYNSLNRNIFIYSINETYICRPFVVGEGVIILSFIGKDEIKYLIKESVCVNNNVISFRDAETIYGEEIIKYDILNVLISKDILLSNQNYCLKALIIENKKKLFDKILKENTEYVELKKTLHIKPKAKILHTLLAICGTIIGLFITIYLFLVGENILYIILCFLASFIPIVLFALWRFSVNDKLKNKKLDAMHLIEAELWTKINMK